LRIQARAVSVRPSALDLRQRSRRIRSKIVPIFPKPFKLG
jgi:hypothetical protein